MSRKVGAPGLGREWIINFLNGDGFLSFPNLRQYYLTQMCRFFKLRNTFLYQQDHSEFVSGFVTSPKQFGIVILRAEAIQFCRRYEIVARQYMEQMISLCLQAREKCIRMVWRD